MKGGNRPVRGFSLETATFAAIDFKAKQEGVNKSKALDMIVLEWSNERKDARRAEASKPSYLDNLATKIETIDRLADEVITKLKRASK